MVLYNPTGRHSTSFNSNIRRNEMIEVKSKGAENKHKKINWKKKLPITNVYISSKAFKRTKFIY